MLDFLTQPIAGIFRVWQIPLVVVLIVLIIFWKRYRSKQM